MEIYFKIDYSPRKKGEVVDLETKLAEYYISIGVAKPHCEGCEDAEPCEECNKTNGIEATEKSAPKPKAEKPAPKKHNSHNSNH